MRWGEERPGAYIYNLDQDGVNRIEYTETEHYRVTRDFINKYDKMLKVLLED